MPSFADGCELDLQGDGQVVRIVAGTDRVAAERRERGPIEVGQQDHPIVAVLRGGPARLLDLSVPADEPLFGPLEDPSSARSLGMTTAVLAPISVAGKVVGSLALGRGPSGRRFDAGDLSVAVDLARRIGLGWYNAVLLAERASILASLHDGLVVTDADGVVLEVNERWCEISGFTAEACIGARRPYPWWPPDTGAGGDPAGDAAIGADASLQELEHAADEALRTGRVEARVVLRRADGSRLPALVSVSPVVDRATGGPRALVASIKDLTQWESAEADLAGLQRVTAKLAAARDVDEVVRATLTEVVARTGADAAFVLRLGDDGQHLQSLGAYGVLAGAVLDRGDFPVDRVVPSNLVVRDGRTIQVGSQDELLAAFPDMVPDVGELGIASVLATPIRHQGEAVGALTVWSTRAAAFGSADVLFLDAVAGQCSQALQRAEGYELAQRSSHALQRRLLSDVPVLHERVTIATRYEAAAADVIVGGDWYDVIPGGPDRLAVVVGDVVGSGIDAAAVMGQLRSALKGFALVDPEPIAVLEALDRLADVTAGAVGATVCYAIVDLAAGSVRFARAGHPPPVLVARGTDGGARFLEGLADPPLGMGRGRRRDATEPFATGDVLLMYTDGLVEQRGADLGERLELLRSAAAAAPRDDVEALVDHVLEVCVGSGPRRDDLAVLAVRDEPASAERFRALVPASSRELGPLRRSLRAWLVEAGVDDLVADDLVLATSEAATNAVEHAYRDIVGSRALIGVTASTVAGGGAVRVDVRDAGRWKARPSHTGRGRGLSIARALLGEVDIRTGPSGTTVSFAAPRASHP